jgi:ADP-heptose:LPS heptosyltransferase
MIEARSRTLDNWVGKPLCALLTGVRRVSDALRRPAVDSGAPRRIAFVKLSEMGAILLAVPAFRAARSRVGSENLYCIVLAGNREVHELIDVFPPENILSIRDDNLFVFALDVARMMWRCRRDGVDTVIDLEGFVRISAILSYLSGAPRRIGLHRYTTEGPYRGDLFTRRVLYNYYKHVSIQFLSLVEALDAPPGSTPLLKSTVAIKEFALPRCEASAAEARDAEALIARAKSASPDGLVVILNCNLIDSMPLRRWPRESWRRLGRRLLAEDPTTTLLLTGLPEERELSRALAAEISGERAFSVAGETKTLRTLVALIDRADAFVTSDCGPAHMAAVTDTSIVSIFGPETPQLYAPLSDKNESLFAGLACSPCVIAFNHRRSPCDDNVCMQRVTVEQVYEATRRACPDLERRETPSQTER